MKVLLLVPFFFLVGCQPKKSETETSTSNSSKVKVVEKKASERENASDRNSNRDAIPSVVLKTTKGDITIELDPDKAPITVENFLTYVDTKFYDGTIFHRVMSDFMIQGGGFGLQDDIPTEKPNNDSIKNESEGGLGNSVGTVAMARLPDPDSATSQFFINVADNNSNLNFPPNNGGYAVFGKVTAGMDVVNEIKMVRTSTKYMNSISSSGAIQAGSHQNIPITPVIIESIRRTE